MKDLKDIFRRTMENYQRYNEKVPVLQEFAMGYRWLMAVDTKGRLSQALRVGSEKPQDEYEGILRSLIGKSGDRCLEQLFSWGDPELRTIAVSILNLLSKPFNTEERLAERGIRRSAGLNFAYDVRGKKAGIIGYGLYNDFFLGKCAEFHAFDLRKSKSVLSVRIEEQESTVYPQGICWHLGANALESAEILAKLDIVIMTGCTIVNDTYRHILRACKKAQIRGIYGPSCELCPEYLFDLGYNYVFSASVRNKEEYMNATFAPLPVGNDLHYMDKYELTRSGMCGK